MTFTTRFAPSPTGPLHLGHAYSALLAYDMARARSGRFLLRIEDTDTSRARDHWEDLIFQDLVWLGLRWELPVLRQSEHLPLYVARLDELARAGLVYPCSCRRSDIRAALSAPHEGMAPGIYPGTCRHRDMASRRPDDALRLNMARAARKAGMAEFVETGPARAGRHRLDPARLVGEIGDAVLARRGDGAVSYVLASVIDDSRQRITEVVRGEDLFQITFLQVLLQSLFGFDVPRYHHHRLIRDQAGKRLAKRDDARALAKYRAEGAGPADIRDMVGLPAA